ncbi:MAG TPA: serine hydrolase domain-containing protein [Thermoleophilaceae bacterium]|nr:serine hydrolase domain-containing protein [Thermoleophilaceae bacterium]
MLDRLAATPAGPPGVSVLIQRGERREYRQRGVGNVGPDTPPGVHDHVRIASVSKAFSGAVALALVDRGRLELNDTVDELLPGLLPRARRVTLRQALHHTGGLPDYIRDERFIARLQADPTGYMSPRRLVRFVRDKPLRFRPGTRYEYSDTDNIVVALMAEAATGTPYERLLARHAYRPVGLRTTSLPRTVRMPAPFMRGYEVAAGLPAEDVTRAINPALAWASGGMVSTVSDLNYFFRAYVGGDLFDARERRAQRRFRPGSSSPPGPGRNAAGLGIFRYRTGCGTVYGHTGSFPGYRLFAASSADGRRSVAFVVNAQIVPGQGSPAVSNLIRAAQAAAVCHALRR